MPQVKDGILEFVTKRRVGVKISPYFVDVLYGRPLGRRACANSIVAKCGGNELDGGFRKRGTNFRVKIALEEIRLIPLFCAG